MENYIRDNSSQEPPTHIEANYICNIPAATALVALCFRTQVKVCMLSKAVQTSVTPALCSPHVADTMDSDVRAVSGLHTTSSAALMQLHAKQGWKPDY